ncbi:pyridoxal phosphate-dependent transferase [Dioszegia hungarica]|uniref:Kynureninase n=1 Tax=Dioszegia hungarica TaxID=4972 RepID=A0AA38H7P1_9TREE|nr:pyridoxal phosphate-dependent transferase [Dioszegia hungarica]KAI9635268.1 pyridoxal phosphate-dependent transferase [Dioszegia hungarica]
MESDSRPTMEALKKMDEEDRLNWTRGEFEIPSVKACGGDGDGEAIYFCGNSLGLLNKKARQHIMEELEVWSTSSVTGHFSHPYSRPWKHVDRPLTPHLAKLVGATEEEVAHTSTLTSNMHNLFTSFYRPTTKRWKIVIEQGSFPSDWYAVHSHPRLHDAVLSPEQIEEAIIPLKPREGEETLCTEDILKVIEENKDTIAIVWLPLVQYYTGQLFDIAPLAKKSHEIGALIGLDLAHGIGNVDCKLDEWNVDFAVWCTYKYLNAGPSAIGGMFVRSGLDDKGKRLAGWWGNDAATRFKMEPEFRPTPGAKGYQHSCTPVLSSIPLLATLELIGKVGFSAMREKAIRLTSTLETLLRSSEYYVPLSESSRTTKDVGFTILTPEQPWRGTQLSVFITGGEEVMPRVFGRCLKKGLVGDERRPNVIRLSPVVLYNTFEDVGRAVEIFEQAIKAEREGEAGGSENGDEQRDVIGGDGP